MLIVSQDRDIILNFENFNCIYIDNNKTNRKLYARADFTEYMIGEYKTEERAKEVLQEITVIYQASKLFSDTKGVLIQEEMCEQMQQQGKNFYKFQMPEE